MTYQVMRGRTGVALLILLSLGGCKSSDLFDVPAPVGFVSSAQLNSQASAEDAFVGARGSLFGDLGGYYIGLIQITELLSDEFSSAYYDSNNIPTDARYTVWTDGKGEAGDTPLEDVLADRSTLLLTINPLSQYETGDTLSQVGEAYALIGYTELLMAEDYCAGAVLSQANVGGGITYGTPISTDSLLSVAESHFQLALMHAHGNDTVTALASVGLGRTLLDRQQYDSAANAVVNVPTNFTYNIVGETNGQNQYPPTFYEYYLSSAYGYGYVDMNMSDREGGNGLDYVSAHDPRLLVDSTLWETEDYKYSQLSDSAWYYPLRFGNPAPFIPLATGIEARLIAAEAALPQHNGNASVWLADLNALRNTTCSGTVDSTCTYGTGVIPSQPYGLLSLTDPGTDTGRVSLMFRERAFWLFGSGNRLSDMRRLIRQYGRTAATVFPSGIYPEANRPGVPSWAAPVLAPFHNYGTAVNFSLPTVASRNTTTNPNYKGCTSSTDTP